MATNKKETVPATPEQLKRIDLMMKNKAYDMALDYIERSNIPYFLNKISHDPLEYEFRSLFTQGELFLEQFITVDEEMLQMKEDAIKIAKSSYEVLVTGRTGTGKELISKSMIWDRKGLIKSVNCAGFPRELMESELFGYVQGAFTGAMRNTDGLMVAAKDGVMFLDEIGEMPLDMQAKLLRAIQEKSVRKVGAKVEESINCKFVCATNRNLKDMVKLGTFREDLYARISTLEIRLSDLIDRKCDVIPITKSIQGGQVFLDKYGTELENSMFDLSLNVRSLQKLVIRYNVLGIIHVKNI